MSEVETITAIAEALGFGVASTFTLFGLFILYLIFGSETSEGFSFLTLVQIAFFSLTIGLSGLYFILV